MTHQSSMASTHSGKDKFRLNRGQRTRLCSPASPHRALALSSVSFPPWLRPRPLPLLSLQWPMRNSWTTENWKVSEGAGGDQAWPGGEGEVKAGGRRPGPGGVKSRVQAPGQEAGRAQEWAQPWFICCSSSLLSDPDYRPITAAGGWESCFGHPVAPGLGHCPWHWCLRILH